MKILVACDLGRSDGALLKHKVDQVLKELGLTPDEYDCLDIMPATVKGAQYDIVLCDAVFEKDFDKEANINLCAIEAPYAIEEIKNRLKEQYDI